MPLKIDPITKERIFELVCNTDGCETAGGEIRFPENHGRENDEVLKAELSAQYSHSCDTHSPND
jgi:hypothetical protein